MKGFEQYLQRSMRTEPDWTQHYLDYALLKRTLKSFYKRRRQFQSLLRQDGYLPDQEFEELLGTNQPDDSYVHVVDTETLVDARDASLRLAKQERQQFSTLLQNELTKVANFYSQTLLVNLKDVVYSGDYETASTELLETTAFCVANIIAFRQVLIRYDAFRRTFNSMALTEWQMQQQQHDGALLKPLVQRNSVVDDFFRMRNLQDYENHLLSQQHSEDLATRLEQFQHLLEKTNSSVQRAVAGHLVFRDRVLATIRQYFLFGLQSYGLNLEPKVLVMRGRHLKKEMKRVAKLVRVGEAPPVEDTSLKSRFQQLERGNILPLLLNLISCFLFMMNNYIIEPSSAYYANALGSSDALSGIMIGAAPWFALVSSVCYSFWTNFSYKAPILFAGVLMLVGNLLYANAYSYQSMEMCLIGRAITGLGAPRVINRRYVADATPFSLRTAASAAFAMSTALGAALGPGMAILLDMVEFEFSLPLLGKQYFNGMTGPGYFMALCWFLNTLAILFTFSEPKRSGLDELRKREQKDEMDSVMMATSQKSLMGDSLSVPPSKSENDESDDDDDDLSYTSSASLPKSPSTDSSTTTSSVKFCGCIQHMTRAVAICMSLIFMKRISLESIVGSTSVITKNRYGWSIKNVGTLHLVNGIIVIPVSILSGWLSTFYQDRYMAIWFLAVTLFGMIIMLDVTDFFSHDNDTYNEGHWLAVGPIRYIAGSLIAFSGIEACESYVASLMSKVVPSALAVGTFNSGLLATLVGTGGRATGDLIITLLGLISIRNLLNLLIVPGAALVIVSIALIRFNYDLLGV